VRPKSTWNCDPHAFSLVTATNEKRRTVVTQRFRKPITVLGVIAAVAVGAASAAQARGGADDPATHNAGDDHGGLVATAARHGADDPANHDAGDDRRAHKAHARHRHHRHHGTREARHGADDPANHDAGDDHGGR
jgi:hypothetical protein